MRDYVRFSYRTIQLNHLKIHMFNCSGTTTYHIKIKFLFATRNIPLEIIDWIYST